MTPAERDELNAAVTRLVQPDLFDLLCPVNYLGNARLWAPILERLLRAGYSLERDDDCFILTHYMTPGEWHKGETIPEAVLRLFVALEGKV